MTDSNSPKHKREGHFPDLSISEWIIYAVLAGLLAMTNIYTTLLTGWGDTGSIVAVLSAVLVLGALGKKVGIQSLNLGQTMASAGGSIGFAAAQYAAVKIIDKDFNPPLVGMIVLFFAMGILGAIVGSSVRKYLVRYYFPSGTACAVIQRTVTAANEGDGSKEALRPVWLLKVWGGIAALATLPTKISLTKGSGAVLGDVAGKTGFFAGLGLTFEPLLYGIGIVVGPRIGVGIFIGGITAWKIIPELTAVGGIAPEQLGDWVRWSAIAALTLPSFASILFAYVFKTPASIPPGFTPGATDYVVPKNRNVVYAVLGVIAAAIIAVTAQVVFDLSWVATVATIALAWPLCVMNGRVAGDTDINPVRLVAIVILSLFAAIWAAEGAIFLLAMAIVGGSLAAIAVDMMYDYRTGFLVDANPTHQTSVQFVGAAVGALVAVPFVILIIDQLNVGPGSSLPAPGSVIWATMADSFAKGFDLPGSLITAIVAISIVGVGYAYLATHPKTAKWTPSLFGIGIGLLLPTNMTNAIFIGALIKFGVMFFASKDKHGEAKAKAKDDSNNDTMLVGAAIFAASALLSVLVILVAKLLEITDLQFFYLPGGH